MPEHTLYLEIAVLCKRMFLRQSLERVPYPVAGALISVVTPSVFSDVPDLSEELPAPTLIIFLSVNFRATTHVVTFSCIFLSDGYTHGFLFYFL
jgi:hypothetical protein